MTACGAFLAISILAIDLSLPLGVAGGVPYVALVCLGWYGSGTRRIVVLGVTSSLFTAVGYYYSPDFPDGGPAWVAQVNRLLAFIAIWLTAAVLIAAKRAKETAVTSQKRLSEILKVAPEAIISVDEQQRILLFNKGAEIIFGYSAEETLGRPLHMLLPSRYRDMHARLLTRFGHSPADPRDMAEQRKVVGQRKDGSEFPAKGGISKLDLAGETIFTVMLYDCTKEEEARQQIVELARFPGENPNPVLRVKPDGAIHYANQAADEVAELFAGGGRGMLAGCLAKEVAQAIDTGIRREVDFIAGKSTLAIAINPVADMSYANLYVRNITLRKKTEAALHKANETLENRVRYRTARLESEIAAHKETEKQLEVRVVELQSANEAIEEQGGNLVELAEDLFVARVKADAASHAKSEFLASMSHELRTPLNAIIGFSDIMNTEALGPIGSARYKEYAGDINESGLHLLSLINDVLDLSKIESGNEELREEDVSVPLVTESALRLVRQRAEQHGVKVELEQPDDLPALHADARKLKQILVNLLTNSIKFTAADGTVVLKTWCDADRGHVFQVVDTGIGIAPEDIPKALSQFGQIDSSVSRKHVGTGLGLPLSKTMAELHGGSLDLQSEVGVGTTVTVRFPAHRIVDLPTEKVSGSAA